MTTVDLKKVKFLVENGAIRVSEREVSFDTKYEVISSKTNLAKVFDFTHSTGPEFDINTEWVYASEDGIEFRVCNDRIMTAEAGAAYLKAKLGR
jgi:hypothetical protein